LGDIEPVDFAHGGWLCRVWQVYWEVDDSKDERCRVSTFHLFLPVLRDAFVIIPSALP
jgi:hypothetical protein